MSRSIFTRASSARSRLISICSALTGLLSAPLSLPSLLALTQLNSVCSTTPSVRAAAAMLWPASTNRTASRLNSSVYRALVVFVISVLLACIETLSKGYVFRGQGQSAEMVRKYAHLAADHLVPWADRLAERNITGTKPSKRVK